MRTRGLFLMLAAFGMAAAACTNSLGEKSTESGLTPVRVTFKAVQAEGKETKTVRNEDKSVSWMPADAINVFCGTDNGKFTSTNTSKAAVVNFTGELTAETVAAIEAGTNEPIWALYPYDENAECDGTSVTTTLPANQTGVAGSFADDLFITLAKSDDLNLYFYNVCSGFKFSVTREGVTSVTLKGNADEDLAGKVQLSFGTDGTPKIDGILDGQKSITLTPENGTFEVGEDYYFVTLPTSFSSGFTLEFEAQDEKTGIYTYKKEVSFPRSKFVTKADIDASVSYKKDPKMTLVVEDELLYRQNEGANVYVASGVEGTIIFGVDGVVYSRWINNGKAHFNINLPPGDYVLTASYSGDDEYHSWTDSKAFSVVG